MGRLRERRLKAAESRGLMIYPSKEIHNAIERDTFTCVTFDLILVGGGRRILAEARCALLCLSHSAMM